MCVLFSSKLPNWLSGKQTLLDTNPKRQRGLTASSLTLWLGMLVEQAREEVVLANASG